MITYYILENDKIVLFDQDKENILNTIKFMPQYAESEILETQRPISNSKDGPVFADTLEYIEQQEQKEIQRIAMLNLTAADVERALYKAFGKDFEDIVNLVEELQPLAFDIKALKIELKANNFYRGNPYIEAVGNLLGITSGQLNEFFETNDYTKLLPFSEQTTEVN